MASTTDFWDQEFWDDLTEAQQKAIEGIHSLYDEMSEGFGCDCTQCVVNVVLDKTWPVIDAYVAEKIAATPAASPTGCGGRCGGVCKADCGRCARKG